VERMLGIGVSIRHFSTCVVQTLPMGAFAHYSNGFEVTFGRGRISP
jgi:hypothetical protein